jgi:hypothetical protein
MWLPRKYSAERFRKVRFTSIMCSVNFNLFCSHRHNCKKYIVVDGTRQCHTQWSYFTKAPEGMVLNSLGIAICLAAAVIAFIVTRTGWRRKAHGSENVQLLVSDRL